MNPYQHILIATDFTEFSEKAARRAKLLAEQSGARLTLFHVIEELVPYSGDLEPLLLSPELDDELKVLAESKIKDFASNTGLTDAALEVQWGSPKWVLPEWAEANSVDLIVIGTHGHSGLARLLGSVSNGVVHHAHCDVLVVK